MHTSVVMVTGYDPGYLTIFEHLLKAEVARGHRALALDITGLLAAPTDSYHRGAMRFFRLAYPGHDLARRVQLVGAEYLDATLLDGADDRSPLGDTLEEALAIAVRSASITFHRTDRPDPRRRSVARIEAALRDEGRTVYRIVENLCRREPDLDLAFVPNGRFPHQRLAKLAFEDAGVATRHVEKGATSTRAYVQDYSPHDRFRSQGSVDPVLAGREDAEVEAIADAWLARRAPAADSHNEYSALWTSGLPARVRAWHEAGDKIAGFFTSSQDEFEFQGAEWQLHEWVDQWESFDTMMTRLESLGYRCYLRVHPNLATRAHDYFAREREGIRGLQRAHPDLVVVGHDDATDSYGLLDVSDAVITWASTIGLEASARGIPVWAGAVTYYGLVADVHEVLSAAELERDGMKTWKVDPRGAKRFIAYLVERDQEVVPGDGWEPWTGRRPRRATIATILVSGGTPGTREALRSVVDVYRHRGLAANLRALRRR